MIVDLRKPVTVRKRRAVRPIDPAQAYGFRLLVAARRRPVSLRKPVSLVKDLRRADARVQHHLAKAKRILRRFNAECASTQRVSLVKAYTSWPFAYLPADNHLVTR